MRTPGLGLGDSHPHPRCWPPHQPTAGHGDSWQQEGQSGRLPGQSRPEPLGLRDQEKSSQISGRCRGGDRGSITGQAFASAAAGLPRSSQASPSARPCTCSPSACTCRPWHSRWPPATQSRRSPCGEPGRQALGETLDEGCAEMGEGQTDPDREGAQGGPLLPVPPATSSSPALDLWGT